MLNIFSWALPNNGRLIVSYGPAGGEAYTHNCTTPGASAQCDNTYGVGRGYWGGVFASVRAVLNLSRSQPNAIVLAYSLHHAHHQLGSRDDLCGDGNLAQYEEHMGFRFASVRAARFGGALIWHSGFMTSFAPNMRRGGAVSRSQAPGAPQGARGLSPAWQCRSKDRLYLLYDGASRAARRHGAAQLDAITISDAWPDETIDNRHFDGGHFMHVRQGTSAAVLNELLNMLSIGRRGEVIERRPRYPLARPPSKLLK
tara:strand:+ start:152 stop:919 length:768 start_codon:yes stop_codon:yes gene_type:complete